jgi:adenosine deaminase
MQRLFQDCFAIPKIELHAHIGGCLRAETFLELAEERRVNVDHIDFYNVDVAGAFEIFKAVAQIITDLDSLERIIREIIVDYAK